MNLIRSPIPRGASRPGVELKTFGGGRRVVGLAGSIGLSRSVMSVGLYLRFVARVSDILEIGASRVDARLFALVVPSGPRARTTSRRSE